MKKKERDETHDHVREELNMERKISLSLIVLIIILLILGVLLSLFSDDNSHLAIWIRELFNKK